VYRSLSQWCMCTCDVWHLLPCIVHYVTSLYAHVMYDMSYRVSFITSLAYVHMWCMTYLTVYRSYYVTGVCAQVMYVTTLVPILFLLVMWVRALFLPGSASGMLFFITPDFSKLASVEVCSYYFITSRISTKCPVLHFGTEHLQYDEFVNKMWTLSIPHCNYYDIFCETQHNAEP
jgi:hypothetical protein